MQLEEPYSILLEGYNNHGRAVTKLWLSLAILSVYSIAYSLIKESSNAIPLPFVHIELSTSWFCVLSLGFHSAILLRWMEIYNRGIRLRTRIVEKLFIAFPEVKIDGNNFIKKEIWDYLVYPSTLTVWSGPESLIRSKFKLLNYLALPYLFFLKVLSITVHFGLPLTSIIALEYNLLYLTDSLWVFNFMGIFFFVLGVITIAQGIAAEINYSIKSLNNMKKIISQVK